MKTQIQLISPTGKLFNYSLSPEEAIRPPSNPKWNRIAFAAAHVVCDPLQTKTPTTDNSIDWESTLRYREYLLQQGFSIAEAMDTAQRGMGLSYASAQELIRRSLKFADGKYKSKIYCGAGTDKHPLDYYDSLGKIIHAYQEQAEFIESLGGGVILMASRALAKIAKSAEDYMQVYESVLRNLSKPAILHWLGESFDPELKGYWGSDDFETAMQNCLNIMKACPQKVDGIKLSLLSAEKEKQLRKQLPEGIRLYTGDDFNYPELIAGEENQYSDALLGIFDAIAPAASLALEHLAQGNQSEYYRIFNATLPLARKIFEPPTMYYKAGVVFLAYLNGFQNHFSMLGGMQSLRSISHYSEIFQFADQANLLVDKELAMQRMQFLLNLHGVSSS